MRHTITFFILFAYCFSYCQISIDVRSLGAVGDSATLNTTAIQQATDSVSHNGGGEVIIDSGVYISSTIILESNVTLRITPGTKLFAVPNDGDYPSLPYNVRTWSDTYTTHSLIFAEDATNIRITGGGLIDGNGFGVGYLSVTKNFRPFGFRIHDCANVIIDSINFRSAPQWMGHLTGCTNVHINAITITNLGWGSNDGIDIDCCRGVLVENSNFDTDDDCLPVKTHSENICRDVLVRNCTMASFERAVKVGNETLGPIVNVRFQDITVNQNSFSLPEVPFNAMYIAVTDGGSIDSVFFERIQVNIPTQTSIFIKLNERFNRYTGDTFPLPTVKYVRNIWLKDISATSTTNIPCSVTGIPGYPVQNVNFENVQITVPGNDTALGTTNVPELLTTRPEFNMWGNILPTFGLYVRHETGLVLNNFCVDTLGPDARSYYYFEDTTSVEVLNQCVSTSVGIKNVVGDEIQIYPNPASDQLNVTGMSLKAEGLLLYSTTGALVSATPVLGRSRLSIDVSKLSVGVYFLVARGPNYTLNRKVVVSK